MAEVRSSMLKEIDFIIIVRRIKLLGLLITVGIVIIYIMGLLLPVTSAGEDLFMMNLITLIIALFLCPLSVWIKNRKVLKISGVNFLAAYFNAHILSFALCDFAALICISTNLFISKNLIFSTTGLLLGLGSMYYNFPKESDFEKIVK